MSDEWYTLPGVPSDLLTSDVVGERRVKVDAEITVPPVTIDSVTVGNLPDVYPDQHSQPLTDAQLRASDVVVSLDGESVSVGNFPASYPLPASQVQTDALTDEELRAAPIEVLGAESGAWDYYAGTSGTVSVAGRVLMISATGSSAGGTMSINGGDAIPIPEFAGATIQPKANLTDPTITFTGTDAYVIEVVR